MPMWWSIVLKVISGVAILTISFFISVAILDYFDIPHVMLACPVGKKIVLDKPYALLDGYAYKVSVPSLANIGDTDTEMSRSPAVVCENGRLTGPAHTPYAEVVKLGLGRFSHYRSEVVFSSADNTDPNTNGRQYTIVVPSG
jgi:hypothetical protein